MWTESCLGRKRSCGLVSQWRVFQLSVSWHTLGRAEPSSGHCLFNPIHAACWLHRQENENSTILPLGCWRGHGVDAQILAHLCNLSPRGKLTHTETENQEWRREHFVCSREALNLSREICSVSFSHARILNAFQMLFLRVKQPTP